MAEGKIVAKDLWRTEWAAFARAKEACDARGMAAFLLREHEHLLITGGQNWEETSLASMDVLLYACRAALAAGYQNIYLIDNASTYPPLLAYYQDVIQDGRVRLLTLSRNFGHRALWRARILEYLDIRTPFVYTDPDVLPIEACPLGLVARLYQILRRYPFVDKVGTGLVIDDLPAHVATYARTNRLYRQVPLEEAVDFCPCDTTFALYAPGASYSIGMSISTRGRLQVRHLPWYLDPEHLPDDEAYYVAHADASSTFAKDAKKDD